MILQNRLKLIVISKTVPFYISTYIYFFTYSFFLVLLVPSGLFAKKINCKRNKSNLVELCISISGEIELPRDIARISVWLWNFKVGGSQKERFWAKNQYTQRKALYFENTGSASSSKIGHDFRK